jgi:hypothetical protein
MTGLFLRPPWVLYRWFRRYHFVPGSGKQLFSEA